MNGIQILLRGGSGMPVPRGLLSIAPVKLIGGLCTFEVVLCFALCGGLTCTSGPDRHMKPQIHIYSRTKERK